MSSEAVPSNNMKINFTKMHGCGNDYIFINSGDKEIDSPNSLSIALSDRHTGIGGDGVVYIMHSITADAKMRMFNKDGSEGLMCGNAIRCVAKYLFDNNIVKKRTMLIETASGERLLWLMLKNGTVSSVKVDMGPAELAPPKVPVCLPGDSVISRCVNIGGAEYAITCVSIGNPHAVVFYGDASGIGGLGKLDLQAIGPLFENDKLFPDRVNLELVEVMNRETINIRVWERGSGETLACGTGACAAAVAAVMNGLCDIDSDILVHLPGGDLVVRYTGETIYLTGGCIKVFDGAIVI